MDQEGRSALWYARQGGSKNCADILISSGLEPDFGLPVPDKVGRAGAVGPEGPKNFEKLPDSVI